LSIEAVELDVISKGLPFETTDLTHHIVLPFKTTHPRVLLTLLEVCLVSFHVPVLRLS
jgi:hypothetical protein